MRILLLSVLAVAMIGLMIPSVFAQNDRCDNVNPGALLMNCDFHGVNWSDKDLSGINFSGANISDAILWRADLSDANFSGANLLNTEFYDAKLFRTTFQDANLESAEFGEMELEQVNFSGANLEFAKFTYSDFRIVQFDNASLFGANFDGAEISGPMRSDNLSFDGADLRKASFHLAKLKAVTFVNADLREINLEDADLEAANFRNANLSNAIMAGISAENAAFNGADISHTNISGSYLRFASFENSNLTGSDFYNAILKNVNFENAILINADISEAELYKSNMRNADLTGANIWGTDFTSVNTSQIIGMENVVYEEWDETSEGIYAQTQPNETPCGEGTIFKDGQCILDKREGGGCLIATAAYGSEMAPQVQFLREIRDHTVLQTTSGITFMTAFNQFYYSFSPHVADYERENPVFKEMVKVSLTPLLTSLTLLNYVDIDSEEEMLGYGIGIILLNVGMYFVAPAAAIIVLKRRFNH